MDSFKLTAWNIEHSDKLIDDRDKPDRKRHAEARIDAITAEISGLDADILLIGEGPHGPDRATAFFAQTAPGYRLVTRPEPTPDAYGMKGGAGPMGRQWLWFLIRDGLPITGTLLHLDRWQAMTEAAARGEHADGKWPVSFPKWTDDATLAFSIPETHSHWRHPQVLLADIDGMAVDIIGCHLKSKFNRIKPEGDATAPDFWESNARMVAEMIKARVKLTTECTDIRYYIDARFAADADAAVIVAGDLNDGPGKERIERRFLYHDLVGALQGDVFFARRFLNHALFDMPESERWTVHFEDAVDPGRDPHILLDHILFSQALTRSHLGHRAGFVARSGGGTVEHALHHQITAPRPKYALTSDHRPVSMIFDRNPGPPVS